MAIRIKRFKSRLTEQEFETLQAEVRKRGSIAFWEWQLQRLADPNSNSAIHSTLQAEAHFAAGKIEAGMAHLRESVRLRGEAFPMLRISPHFDAVRQRQDYRLLLAKYDLGSIPSTQPTVAAQNR